MSETREVKPSPPVPIQLSEEIRSLFGKPPLVPGEDGAVYEALQARFAAAIAPRDGVELMWLRDCTDLSWEIHRLRRAKAAIVTLAQKEALRNIFEVVIPEDDVDEDLSRSQQAALMADQWFSNPDSRRAIWVLMEAHHIEPGPTIMAQAVALRSRELDLFEQMIASAEQRRNSLFHQIELRREAVARRMRAEAEIVDAEFAETTALKLEDQRAS